MALRRMRQRLRNLTRPQRVPPITREELDDNTAALVDAVLQSLVFCLSLLALLTCLARLPPPQPRAALPATLEQQSLALGFTG